MIEPNAQLIELARLLKLCAVPSWLTIQRARASYLETPRPEHLAHKFSTEQWADRCRKQHNAAVRRIALYVAKLRTTFRDHQRHARDAAATG